MLSSTTHVEGVSESSIGNPVYAIAEGISIRDINALETARVNDVNLQLFSSSNPFTTSSGKIFKNYNAYKNPSLIDAYMKFNPVSPNLKIHYATTKIVLGGSSTRDRTLIQNICIQNRIKAYIVGNLEQMVITNSIADSLVLFKAFVQGTKFNVIFIDEYSSPLGEEEVKSEIETNGERRVEESSFEPVNSSGTIKMLENGEVVISS